MRTSLVNTISHVAGWMLFFSLILAFLSNSPQEGHSVFSMITSYQFLLFGFVYLFLFYSNYFILIPRLYLQKKYILYFSVILFLFIAVFFLKPFDGLMSVNPPPGQPPRTENRPPPPPGKMPKPRQAGKDMNSVILFITVWSLSTAIPVIRQWRVSEKRALQAETDKANAELSFLKSQVNPHFLFNTLNNIYSLALTKNDNTAPSIMKLSNIMRYVTDEIGHDYVALDDELECIKDYIDLQRLRLGQKMNIEFSVKGNTGNKKIAPLLLMAFVENVFKYGISSHEESGIVIKLLADEHNITFYCQNRLFDTKRNTERTGIGIANARQRLQHLYPARHFLDISTESNLFTVQLTLQA